ncbi:MAG: hypothetical protein AAF348_09845 [Bacteroidota bacterium]
MLNRLLRKLLNPNTEKVLELCGFDCPQNHEKRNGFNNSDTIDDDSKILRKRKILLTEIRDIN